jgi:membrane protein YdbS with pleckstrin-like domain
MRNKNKPLGEVLVVLMAPIVAGLGCSVYYRNLDPLYIILLNVTVPMIITVLLIMIAAMIYRRRIRRF